MLKNSINLDSIIFEIPTYINQHQHTGLDSTTCGSIESPCVATKQASGDPLNSRQADATTTLFNSREVASNSTEQISEFFTHLKQIPQSALNFLPPVEPASNSSNLMQSENFTSTPLKPIDFVHCNPKSTSYEPINWLYILQGVPMIPIEQPALENSAGNCSGYFCINSLDMLFFENA